MKVYVVTSLIENAEIGAEVNIIGIKKDEKQASELLQELLENVKQEYKENDIEYDITDRGNCIVIESNVDEYITLEYQKSEVE